MGRVPISMMSTPSRMYIRMIWTKLASMTSRPKIRIRPGLVSAVTPRMVSAFSPRFAFLYTSWAYASDAWYSRAASTGVRVETRMTFHMPMNACCMDWPLRS